MAPERNTRRSARLCGQEPESGARPRKAKAMRTITVPPPPPTLTKKGKTVAKGAPVRTAPVKPRGKGQVQLSSRGRPRKVSRAEATDRYSSSTEAEEKLCEIRVKSQVTTGDHLSSSMGIEEESYVKIVQPQDITAERCSSSTEAEEESSVKGVQSQDITKIMFGDMPSVIEVAQPDDDDDEAQYNGSIVVVVQGNESYESHDEEMMVSEDEDLVEDIGLTQAEQYMAVVKESENAISMMNVEKKLDSVDLSNQMKGSFVDEDGRIEVETFCKIDESYVSSESQDVEVTDMSGSLSADILKVKLNTCSTNEEVDQLEYNNKDNNKLISDDKVDDTDGKNTEIVIVDTEIKEHRHLTMNDEINISDSQSNEDRVCIDNTKHEIEGKKSSDIDDDTCDEISSRNIITRITDTSNHQANLKIKVQDKVMADQELKQDISSEMTLDPMVCKIDVKSESVDEDNRIKKEGYMEPKKQNSIIVDLVPIKSNNTINAEKSEKIEPEWKNESGNGVSPLEFEKFFNAKMSYPKEISCSEDSDFEEEEQLPLPGSNVSLISQSVINEEMDHDFVQANENEGSNVLTVVAEEILERSVEKDHDNSPNNDNTESHVLTEEDAEGDDICNTEQSNIDREKITEESEVREVLNSDSRLKEGYPLLGTHISIIDKVSNKPILSDRHIEMLRSIVAEKFATKLEGNVMAETVSQIVSSSQCREDSVVDDRTLISTDDDDEIVTGKVENSADVLEITDQQANIDKLFQENFPTSAEMLEHDKGEFEKSDKEEFQDEIYDEYASYEHELNSEKMNRFQENVENLKKDETNLYANSGHVDLDNSHTNIKDSTLILTDKRKTWNDVDEDVLPYETEECYSDEYDEYRQYRREMGSSQMTHYDEIVAGESWTNNRYLEDTKDWKWKPDNDSCTSITSCVDDPTVGESVGVRMEEMIQNKDKSADKRREEDGSAAEDTNKSAVETDAKVGWECDTHSDNVADSNYGATEQVATKSSLGAFLDSSDLFSSININDIQLPPTVYESATSTKQTSMLQENEQINWDTDRVETTESSSRASSESRSTDETSSGSKSQSVEKKSKVKINEHENNEDKKTANEKEDKKSSGSKKGKKEPKYRRSSRLKSIKKDEIFLPPLPPPSTFFGSNGTSEKKESDLKEPIPSLFSAEAQLPSLLSSFDDKENRAEVPSNFQPILENEYHTERSFSKDAERMICDCVLTREEFNRGERGCGDDCLNRLLLIECCSRCTLNDWCSNKRFQKREYPKCEVYKTKKKGHGLRMLEDIPSGTFIMEYVGEVINSQEFEKRAMEYAKVKNSHFYFMSLKSDCIIDATQKGNISRFINHSCEPNAETQKWTAQGELRIGFFSKRRIKAGEEITFDYQLQRYGKQAQRCYCESASCTGWIGQEPFSSNEGRYRGAERKYKKKRPVEQPYIDDLETALDEIRHVGLLNRHQMLNLTRLMVHAKDLTVRIQILQLIEEGHETCRTLFVDYNGLTIISSWMVDCTSSDDKLKIQLLKTLKSLTITNRTILVESKVLPMVEQWAYHVEQQVQSGEEFSAQSVLQSVEDIPLPDETPVSELAQELLNVWSSLREAYKIPKKERIKQMKEHEKEADQTIVKPRRMHTPLYAEQIRDRHMRNRFGRDFEKMFYDRASDYDQNRRHESGTPPSGVSSGNSRHEKRKHRWSENGDSPTRKLSKSEHRQMFEMRLARREEDRRYEEEERRRKEVQQEEERDWWAQQDPSQQQQYNNCYPIQSVLPPHNPGSNVNMNNVSMCVPPPTPSEYDINVGMYNNGSAQQPFNGTPTIVVPPSFQPPASVSNAYCQPPPLPVIPPQYQPPSTPQYHPPLTPQYQPPIVPPYQPPTTPQYQSPYQPPATPQYLPPPTPQYQSAVTSQYQPPTTPQYQTPEPQYQPSTIPQYTTPETICYQSSDTTQYQPPEQYQQPSFSQYQEPATPLYQTPTVPQFQQPPLPNNNYYPAPQATPLTIPLPPAPQPSYTSTASVAEPHTIPPLPVNPESSTYETHFEIQSYEDQSYDATMYDAPSIAAQADQPFSDQVTETTAGSELYSPAISSTSTPSDETVEAPLPPKWRMAKDAEGRVYYYHTKTRVSQWYRPTLEAEQPDNGSSADEGADASQVDDDIRNNLSAMSNEFQDTENEEEEDETGEDYSRLEDEFEDVETTATAEQITNQTQAPQIPAPMPLTTEHIISPREKVDKRERIRAKKRIRTLKEELKRVKKRSAGNAGGGGHAHAHSAISSSSVSVLPADTSSLSERKRKDAFMAQMANFVVACLNPYFRPTCTAARITNHDDFKHLARKLTHFVMLKELKHCQNATELSCNSSVKHKAKEYIRKYMSKFGPIYVRSSDDM